MYYISRAYGVAQSAFSDNSDRNSPEFSRRALRYKSDFLNCFEDASCVLSRQREHNPDQRKTLNIHVRNLRAITELFIRRQPTKCWDTPQIEKILSNNIFYGRQKGNLRKAFHAAIARDVVQDPGCLYYRFLNMHQLYGAPKTTQIVSDNIAENFDVMFDKDQQLTLWYAAILSGLPTSENQRRKSFFDLIEAQAPHYRAGYATISGEDSFPYDPFLLLAMQQLGKEHEEKAIKMLETHIERLARDAVNSSSDDPDDPYHDFNEILYDDQDIITPYRLPDMKYDAFRALLDCLRLCRDRDSKKVTLVNTITNMVVTSFDVLSEHDPFAALCFVLSMAEELARINDNLKHKEPIDEALENLNDTVMGLDILQLVVSEERIHTPGGYGIVYPAILLLKWVHNPNKAVSATNIVISHCSAKLQRTNTYNAGDSLPLLELCETIGPEHSEFFRLLKEATQYEQKNQKAPDNKALESILELAGMMSGAYLRRRAILVMAFEIAERQMEFDPIKAEKNMETIIKICKTPRELELAKHVRENSLSLVTTVAPINDERQNYMNDILNGYRIN